MATIICMDGLAGHPKTQFGTLKKVLEHRGHQVVLCDVKGIRTHEDRVQLVLEAFRICRDERIFLLGQSAGGSAVRIAAERLEKEGKSLSGVILLSPAMPSRILFATRPLLKIMLKRWRDFLFAESITLAEDEFETLVSPILETLRDEILASRQPISIPEARRLAFFPPRFVGSSFPVLLICGAKDKWIAPGAQIRLGRRFMEKSEVSMYTMKGAGHLVLASKGREAMMRIIQKWVSSQAN